MRVQYRITWFTDDGVRKYETESKGEAIRVYNEKVKQNLQTFVEERPLGPWEMVMAHLPREES